MTLKTILRPGLNIALPSPSLAMVSDEHRVRPSQYQACLNHRFWDLREVLRMATIGRKAVARRAASCREISREVWGKVWGS
jgi:hypothetical protein